MADRYVKLVNGLEVQMTAEEIAERQAEEALPPQPKSLYEDAKEAFSSLPLPRQRKYKDEIRDAAFFLKENNIPMVVETLKDAVAKLEPGEEDIAAIIMLAKVRLGVPDDELE